MSAIDQYIKLFEHHRDVIDRGSAEAFNRLRPAALSALKRFGRLPSKSDEGYESISLEEMFAPDFGVNISRVPFAVDVARTFHCDVPNVSTLLGVVVNDEFRLGANTAKNLPEGVTLTSLAAAAKSDPDFVKQYLGSLSDNRDAATALNTLLAQDGVLIRIARGVRLEKPIQIVNIFNADANLMSCRRVLVLVEEYASARVLVCDHSQSADHDYLSSQVIEIFLAQGASLDYCDIEESSDRTSRISQLYARQMTGSQLRINNSSLTVGHTRNEYLIRLEGEHCTAMVDGMAIADGKQIVDNSSKIVHASSRCKSDQTFKYLLNDNARGAFEGLIYVAPDAIHTEAYQNNRNILASTDARMHTAPQLEIYCDDVKCSHGTATGQLDAKALFYMRSRGIDLDQARMMLMQAFMADIIDRVPIDGLRDRLRHLVERRLSGRSAGCYDCPATCHS